MNYKSFFCIAILLAAIIIYTGACGKKDSVPDPIVTTPDPCAGKTININNTISPSAPCNPSGSITVNATGSTGFTYKLNSGGVYQSSPVFNNLSASSYTVFAKDAAGCERSASAVVSSSGTGGFTVTVATNPASNCGGTEGSITVNASGSTGFSYKLNNGAYQAGNTFSNLPAGSNTVTVKDVNGCEIAAAANINVNTTPGPKFAAVKNLLINNCGASACHTNGGNQGGRNFDVDCNIVAAKARINQRAVIEGTMPAAGSLSASNRAIITDWINAGGGFNN